MTLEEIQLRRLAGQHLLAPADQKQIEDAAARLWSNLKQMEYL